MASRPKWGNAAAFAALLVACSAGGPSGPLVESDPQILFHPSQPMVVDLEVELTREASVSVEVLEDGGVRAASIGESAPTASHLLRLRGLAPGEAHTAEVTITEQGEDPLVVEVPFTTLDPLDGFVRAHDVAGAGTDLGGFRLFDVMSFVEPARQALNFVDLSGRTRWFMPAPGAGAGTIPTVAGVKLLPDGNVMYLQDATLHVVDELALPVLSYGAPELGVPTLHHDVLLLPTGNYLAIGRAFEDVYYPDDDATYHVAGDTLVEISPDGEVVWTWNSFDHLDPLRRRADFDGMGIFNDETGEPAKDWTHGNGLEYDSDDDSILLSLRHQDWVLKIDHASGDLLWRLGDGGDFTLAGAAKWFFHQHSPQWQPDGSLLLYDNGVGNPNGMPATALARPVRYDIDESTMTATQVWDDTEESYWSPFAGDADGLANGNVLVLDSTYLEDPMQAEPGHFRLTELDPATNEVVWRIEGAPGIGAYRGLATDLLPGELLQQ